jgi:hypothetical protein
VDIIGRKSDQQYAFSIVTQLGNKYFLAAPSSRVLKEWIDTILQVSVVMGMIGDL